VANKNHEECDQFGKAILRHFGWQDNIRYSLGTFDRNWDNLKALVGQWWRAFKVWEAQDTLAVAFAEQRLTVKGTSAMDDAIKAFDRQGNLYREEAWGKETTFPKPGEGGGFYPIVKTNHSILERMKPEYFAPEGGGASQKTDLGYHDLSGLLLNPNKEISKQQYKGRSKVDPNQVYAFMPLPPALDQAVFQNINALAKTFREEQAEFYTTVRGYRARLTRIKLAAEHDMAVNFVMVGRTPLGRPKFKYTLISKTDISYHDETRETVPKGAVKKYALGGATKSAQAYPTTDGILQARRNAAINYEAMLLGTVMSYGEVTIAYRQHAANVAAGQVVFPKFAQFREKHNCWVVGTVNDQSVWTAKDPEEIFANKPG
jgi:hypothetical protein